MKKIALLLAFLIALPLLLGACGGGTDKTGETEMKTMGETTLPEREDDGVLKVLMIGNSFCYYYLDELYGLLKQSGREAVIANVYYSGCSLYHHMESYRNSVEEFEYNVYSAEGRNEIKHVGLKYCLAAEDWDVISIQQHFYPKLTGDGYEAALATCVPHAEDLVGVLKEKCPYAKLYWNQTWAYQVGYARDDSVNFNLEAQTNQYEVVRKVSHKLAEDLDLTIVPCGDAWQVARANPVIGDNLCTDSTRNNGLGDYYHDGNVGGGQYLNACTWFEVLTGESVVGNLFYPNYPMSRDLMKALQSSAHEAVQALDQTK